MNHLQAAIPHPWDITPEAAVRLQQRLRHEVRLVPLGRPPAFIGGADISFDKGSDLVHAGIVILRYPSLELVEEAGLSMEVKFP